MTARTHTTHAVTLRWQRLAVTLLAALACLILWPLPGRAQAAAALPDFTELVDRVGPSVVNIRTTEKVRPGQMPGPQMDEEMQEFFRRFFGIPLPGPRQDPRRGPRQAPEEEQPRGLGSGFVLSADGYIMTNAHVVDGADEVYVTLADKREFKAKIVGADKRTDVAVVKIDASGLQPVRIGDVGKLKVGEWVVAIGSPFGLENTVTAGIVSAKARETGDYLPFIQTDVAINPGNSGGPLLNMRGEVVGINSQIYSRSGGFMGISFAIPIDEAMRVAEQLRTTGRVIRGRIGVQIDQVTREVAESIGLGKAMGALVRSVEEGGPAARAGMEPGDIITRFDGKAIEKASGLPRIVGNTKPGSKVEVQVFRRGATRNMHVTVAEFEPERSARAAPTEPRPSGPSAGVAGSLGLVVSDLTPAQQRELNVRGGVRVEAAEGPAARAGLREGDVILAVANTEVKDARQFEQLLSRMDRTKPFNVLFRRGEWAQYAVIRPR